MNLRATHATFPHKDVQTSRVRAAYGEGVHQHIFDRVVPAHYGGEVTVLELLTILLSHSTHHVKPAYWFRTYELNAPLDNPAADEDLEGLATPAALF